MQDLISRSIRDSLLALQQLDLPHNRTFLMQVSHLLANTFRKGNKVLVAGNGGSLCDAAHFAEELTGLYRHKRAALPAIALSEPGHITCVGNDLGFEEIFSRSIEAFGHPGDVFVGLTTSGNSPNIVRAFETAKKRQMTTVAFLGKSGGKLRGFADHEMIIEGFSYSDRIQEAHMAAIHMLIEVMEHLLFPNIGASAKNVLSSCTSASCVSHTKAQ